MGAGALVTGLIGIGHLFMPSIGYDGTVAASMERAARDHFYYLGTYAIAGFLLSFAVLSLRFSRVDQGDATVTVCAVLAAFWSVRLGLELRYPVDLPIFFLRNPHPVLVVVIGGLAIAYAASTILALRRRRR